MNITVSSYNNHIPVRDGKISFPNWATQYEKHIRTIFEMFLNELPELTDSRENYIKVAKTLYRYSSRVNIS